MRGIRLLIILCLFFSVAYAAELKVAVVDEQVLMSDYEKSRDLVQKMKNKYLKEEKSLQALNEKIKNSEQNLEKQLKIAGVEQKQQIFESLTQAKIELEVREKGMREAHMFEKNQYTLMVIDDINDAITSLGQEGGYDLILRKYVPSSNGGEPQNNVLFYSDKLDITSEVLKYLNMKYRQTKQ